MGAEVKADLANNLQQGAAKKFYQVLAGGRAAWEYKDKDYKDKTGGRAAYAGLDRRGSGYFKKAYGHIPNFAAARLALAGGLVGKNKFGNIDRRQMTRLVRSNPYFNGLMNEHLTWDSFPKKDKRKLSRWLLKQGVSNRALQAYGLASMHSKSIGEGISNLAMAKGYIPNFADPLSDAIGREKAAGVPVSQIRVGSHGALMGKGNPLGLGVTNTHDEPNGLRDVFGANGFVPNYAVGDFLSGFRMDDAKRDSLLQSREEYAKTIKEASATEKKLTKTKEQQTQALSRQKQGTSAYNRAQQRLTATSRDLDAAVKTRAAAERKLAAISNSTARGAATRQRFAGSGMMMMMGTSMASGYLQSGGAEKGGTAYQAGGALQGAATGAMMASMVAPFLGPAAPFVVAAGALYGAFDGWNDAMEQNTKALKEKEGRRLATQYQSASQTFSKIIQGEELTKDIQSAGLTSAIKAGFDPKMTVGQTLYQMGSQEEQAINLDELFGPNWAKELPQFKNISEEDRARKEKTYRKTFAKMQKTYNLADYASGERTDPNYNLSNIDDDDIRGVSGFLNTMGYTNIQSLRQSLLSKGSGRRQARGQAVDYFLDNEKADKFKFKFEEGGQDILFQKDEYRKLLKGESAKDISGKERKAELSQINKKLREQGVLEEEYNNSKNGQARGVITQLNLQKAQIAAQQAAAVKQLEIKENYSKISDNLKFEEKLMGSLMTDQQKAQSKYLQAINKAEEAYSNAAASADNQLRTGILAQLKVNDPLQGELKKALRMNDTSSFQDISERVGSLTGKELKSTLESIASEAGENSTIRKAINELLSLEITKMENILSLAERQKGVSTSQADREREINGILAGRAEIIKDLERKNRMSSEGLRSSQKIRGFTEQVAAAKRLNAVGPGYQTGREREDFAMSEKGFRLESKITTLEENKERSIRELNIEKEKTNQVVDQDKLKNLRQNKKDAEDYSEPLLISDQDLETLNTLEKLEAERKKKLEEIEQKIKNITKETNKQISSEQALLDKEKERLEIKRKHETGSGAFGRGLAGGMKSMAEQVETMDYELGQRIPQAFADGLSNAMVDAINGTKSIKEGLMDAAIGFLGMIQKAMMQKMVMQAMGSMGFSQGGNVRNYSKGGNVPARVSDGEYLMSREAVNKYGGSFMHGLNAGGRAPEFASGGEVFSAGLIGGGISSKILEGKKKRQDSLRTAVENNLLSKGKIKREEGSMGAPVEQGSALAQNFGGGRGFDSGRLYQKRAMSSAFYAQSDNVGLTEDTGAMQSILSEEDHIRQMEKARREAKKAKRKQLMNMAIGVAAQFALGKIFSGSSGPKMGLGRDTISRMPESSFDFSGVKSSPVGDFSQFGDYNYSSQLGRLYNGGPIRKYASGGHIAGKSGIDQIPAMLSEGEYVIKASSARQLGKPMLDQINAGKFQFGGEVSPINSVAESTSSGGNTNNISISVNIKKGTGEDATQVEDAKPNSEDGGPDGAQEFADKIKTQVVAVIVQEQRPGGLLFD